MEIDHVTMTFVKAELSEWTELIREKLLSIIIISLLVIL